MRTILTRIFSTFLLGVAALSMAAAPQTVAKVTGVTGTKAASAVVNGDPRDASLLDQVRVHQIGAKAGQLLAPSTGTPTFKKVNVPGAAAAGVPTNMYGSIVYSDFFTDASDAGVYTIPATADGNQELLISGASANYGGVMSEGIYYCAQYQNIANLIFYYRVYGFDMETGAQVFYYNGTPENLFPGGATVDPTSGTIYAITFNSAGNGRQFAKIEFGDNTLTVTPIAAVSDNFNSLAAAADGTIYGITYTETSSSLVKFDKTNGTYTTIGQTGMVPHYLSSAAIDQKTNKMYWNVCAADETGTLCEVDLTTGAATLIYQFPGNDEVMGLTIPVPEADDKAPAAVKDLTFTFNKGELTGKVSFTCPATLVDGSRGFGDLTYYVVVDGETVSSGATTYNESVTTNVSVPAAGTHTFQVYVANAKGNGPKSKVKMFVGNGIPNAPKVTATWANGVATLNWAAVNTSADGGYVNPDEVTYTVTEYPSGKVLATNLGTNMFSVKLPMPETQTVYSYGVTATYAGATSTEGISNTIVLGDIVPPYKQTFDDATSLSGWTIIDANGDAKKWSWSNGAVRMMYNLSKDMDDYLITPAIKMKAGQATLVSFDIKTSASYEEKFEILYGTEPNVAAMTKVIVEPTAVKKSTYETYSGYMAAETDGNYYVAVHGISAKNMYYIDVDNFTLGNVINANVPAAVEGLTIIPGANGALNATVEFTTPAVNMLGEELSSITKIQVLRGDDVVFDLDGAAVPGKKYTVTDANIPAAGEYTYTVKIYNEYGEGETATADTYIGVNYPVAPTNVELIETEDKPGEVSVVWDPVTTDINGDPIAAADVTYIVAQWSGSAWEPVATGITKNYYTYQAVAAGEQTFVQYAVFASTQRGEGDGAITDFTAVGTPYKNYSESFTNGTLSYILGTGPVPGAAGSATWSIFNDASFTDMTSVDGDNGFIGSKGTALNYCGRLMTGKIAVEGLEKPGLTFYTYNIVGDDVNTVAVWVNETYNAEFTTQLLTATAINSIDDVEGWVKVTVDLSAYKGKTIQLAFDTSVQKYLYTFLDNFKVGNLLDNDLVASKIAAPANIASSTPFNVDVTVTNEGLLEAAAYTVELYADGKKVAEKAGEALAAGAKAVVTFEQEFTDVQVDAVAYQAKVVYAADEDNTNNESAVALVAPKVSNLPAPTDLAVEKVANGLKVTWAEPNLTFSPEVTEDFEDGESFAAQYGNWTFVDVDQSPVGGFQNMDLPGITVGQSTGSFWVWDQAVSGGNATFDAHSGNKYLFGLFRYDDGTVDDWAISPALSGDAQTISFWAKSYSDQYPDAFEVWYSTGSLEPADFIKVNDKVVCTAEWTEYTANLPEGAKHFAIRSCATSSFMFEVDDVTYAPEGAGELTLVGYDVYRDGVKINTATVEETSFVDAAGVNGSAYQVVAIFTIGKSKPSATVVYEESGLADVAAGVAITTAPGTIIVTGAADAEVSVVAVDGKVLYVGTGDAKVAVLPGVYVVKAGDKVAKVAVK